MEASTESEEWVTEEEEAELPEISLATSSTAAAAARDPPDDLEQDEQEEEAMAAEQVEVPPLPSSQETS